MPDEPYDFSQLPSQRVPQFRPPQRGGAYRPSAGQRYGAPRPYGPHTGEDFAWPKGTAVGTKVAGRVRFAGRKGGYGNRVEIEHDDGTVTSHSHLDRIGVSEGDDLDSGSLVGYVGMTGDATGPNDHFEVIRGGKKINPEGSEYQPLRDAKEVRYRNRYDFSKLPSQKEGQFDFSQLPSQKPAPPVANAAAIPPQPSTSPTPQPSGVNVGRGGAHPNAPPTKKCKVEPGNNVRAHRPVVHNDDGSISTVRSISIGADGREVLIPTVSDDGRLLSNDEAIAQYRKTGKHLGVFDNAASSTAYAQALHKQQEQVYARGGQWPQAPAEDSQAADALAEASRAAAPPQSAQSRQIERGSLPIDTPDQIPGVSPYRNRVEPTGKPGSVRVVNEELEAKIAAQRKRVTRAQREAGRARRQLRLARSTQSQRQGAASTPQSRGEVSPERLAQDAARQDALSSIVAPELFEKSPGTFFVSGNGSTYQGSEHLRRLATALAEASERHHREQEKLDRLTRGKAAETVEEMGEQSANSVDERILNRAFEGEAHQRFEESGEPLPPAVMSDVSAPAPEAEVTAARLKYEAEHPPIQLTPDEGTQLEEMKGILREKGGYDRAAIQGSEAFFAKVFHGLGNVAEKVGASDTARFLKARAAMGAQASAYRPEPENFGHRITRLGMETAADLAVLVGIQRATGARLPTVMAGEALVQTLDKRPMEAAHEVTKAYLMGRLFEGVGSANLRPVANAVTQGGVGYAVTRVSGGSEEDAEANALLFGALGAVHGSREGRTLREAARELPRAAGERVLTSSAVPESVRGKIAEALGYRAGVAFTENGRYASVYYNPETKSYGVVPVTEGQAAKLTGAKGREFYRVDDRTFDLMAGVHAEPVRANIPARAVSTLDEERRRAESASALEELRRAPDRQSFETAVEKARSAGASPEEIDAALRPKEIAREAVTPAAVLLKPDEPGPSDHEMAAKGLVRVRLGDGRVLVVDTRRAAELGLRSDEDLRAFVGREGLGPLTGATPGGTIEEAQSERGGAAESVAPISETSAQAQSAQEAGTVETRHYSEIQPRDDSGQFRKVTTKDLREAREGSATVPPAEGRDAVADALNELAESTRMSQQDLTAIMNGDAGKRAAQEAKERDARARADELLRDVADDDLLELMDISNRERIELEGTDPRTVRGNHTQDYPAQEWLRRRKAERGEAREQIPEEKNATEGLHLPETIGRRTESTARGNEGARGVAGTAPQPPMPAAREGSTRSAEAHAGLGSGARVGEGVRGDVGENDILHLRLDNGKVVTVFKNPTNSDFREINKRFREEYPNAPQGEPTSRFTKDAEGNSYRWMSGDAVHFQVEPALKAKLGVDVNQNMAALESQPPARPQIPEEVDAAADPREFHHTDFGDVVEVENQKGVPQGSVRVTDEQGSEHVIQEPGARGGGNERAVPVRHRGIYIKPRGERAPPLSTGDTFDFLGERLKVEAMPLNREGRMERVRVTSLDETREPVRGVKYQKQRTFTPQEFEQTFGRKLDVTGSSDAETASTQIGQVRAPERARAVEKTVGEEAGGARAETPAARASVVGIAERAATPTESAQPSAARAKAKEKADPKTGLNGTQEKWLGGKLGDYAERNYINTEQYPKGDGETSPVELLEYVGKANSRRPYAEAGEPETFDVPGDGSFTVNNVAAANRLHQKITGKPIEGLPKERNATVGTSSRVKNPPSTASQTGPIALYGHPVEALEALRPQRAQIQQLADEAKDAKEKAEHQKALAALDSEITHLESVQNEPGHISEGEPLTPLGKAKRATQIERERGLVAKKKAAEKEAERLDAEHLDAGDYWPSKEEVNEAVKGVARFSEKSRKEFASSADAHVDRAREDVREAIVSRKVGTPADVDSKVEHVRETVARAIASSNHMSRWFEKGERPDPKEIEKRVDRAKDWEASKRARKELQDAYAYLKFLPKETAGRTPTEVAAARRTTERLEDYGEKIGGAKKDLAKRLADVTSDEIKNKPLSQSFPRPDFAQLVRDEIVTKEGAKFLSFLYNHIPPKPRKPYRVAGWAKQVESAIAITKEVVEGDNTKKIDFTARLIKTTANPHLKREYEIYSKIMDALGFPESSANVGDYEIKQFGGRDDYTIVKGAHSTVADFPTLDAAVAGLKALLENNKEAAKSVRFDLYQDRTTKDFFIGKKGSAGVVRVAEGFKTSKEARAFLKDRQAELEAVWGGLKVNPNERRAENRERVGNDWRKGEDVAPEKLAKTFGFRGIEFGNWVNNAERQTSINEAYDGLMDMAAALGIKPQSVSLNGELALAFGARGGGQASAHYERDRVVINLTKTKGKGSLGHEWWHALDNYFSRTRGLGDSFLTESPRQRINRDGSKDARVRPEMIEAYKGVMDAINSSGLGKRSTQLDRTRTKRYWSTPVEMSARSFENFLINKLAQTNEQNDYLANFKDVGLWVREQGLNLDNYPYPLADESEVIDGAFQHFFNAIEEKETDEGVALYMARAEGEKNLEDLRDTAFHELVPKATVRRGGHLLEVNAEGHEILRRAFEQRQIEAGVLEPEGEPAESSFDGVFLKPEQIKETATTLRAAAKELLANGYPKESAEKLNSFAAKLTRAGLVGGKQSGKNTAIVYVYDEAIPHEEWHRAGFVGAVSEALASRHAHFTELASHPVIQKAWDNYFSRVKGYSRLDEAVLVEETGTWIAGGKADKLGLSEEEATDYLDRWLESYADKNGDDALENFAEVALPHAGKIISQLRERRADRGRGEERVEGGSQGVQREQERPGEAQTGDRAGTEESPQEETGEVKHRRLPSTLREMGLRAADELYEVYPNKAANRDAKALFEKLGFEGSENLLQSTGQMGAEHVQLSKILQRALLSEASKASESDVEQASQLRQRAQDLASDLAARMTKGGQFIQAADSVESSVEDVMATAVKVAKERGRELTPKEASEIHRAGEQLETATATLEVAAVQANESRGAVESDAEEVARAEAGELSPEEVKGLKDRLKRLREREKERSEREKRRTAEGAKLAEQIVKQRETLASLREKERRRERNIAEMEGRLPPHNRAERAKSLSARQRAVQSLVADESDLVAEVMAALGRRPLMMARGEVAEFGARKLPRGYTVRELPADHPSREFGDTHGVYTPQGGYLIGGKSAREARDFALEYFRSTGDPEVRADQEDAIRTLSDASAEGARDSFRVVGAGGEVGEVQGLPGYTVEDVKQIVRDYVDEKIRDGFIDESVEIVDVAVYGSRARGKAKAGSDLDVLVEYDGDFYGAREEGLFDALNGDSDPLEIEGVRVDINPIRADKSGTLEEWLKEHGEFEKSGPLFMARAEGDATPTSPPRTLNDGTVSKLARIGAIRLLRAERGKYSVQGFRRDMLNDFGPQVEPHLDAIHAEAVRVMRAELKRANLERTLEAIKAREGNRDLSRGELTEIAEREKEERRRTSLVQAEHEKVAKAFESKEAREAKEAERIARRELKEAQRAAREAGRAETREEKARLAEAERVLKAAQKESERVANKEKAARADEFKKSRSFVKGVARKASSVFQRTVGGRDVGSKALAQAIARHASTDIEAIAAAKLAAGVSPSEFASQMKAEHGLDKKGLHAAFKSGAEVLEKARADINTSRQMAAALKKASKATTEAERDRALAELRQARADRASAQRQVANQLQRMRDAEGVAGATVRGFRAAGHAYQQAKGALIGMMAGGDLSFFGRQAFPGIVMHPSQAPKILTQALQALWDAKYGRNLDNIERMPNFPVMLQAGVEFTEVGKGGQRGSGEDIFAHNEVLERIPVVRTYARKSEQVFSAPMDWQRAQLMDLYIRQLQRQGVTFKDNPEAYRSMAKLVNIVSARGDINEKNRAAIKILHAFGRAFSFSSRLRPARIQLLALPFDPTGIFWKSPPAARRIIWKETAKWYAYLAGVVGLLATMGLIAGKKLSDIFDPDDPDYLYLAIGNQRIDLTRGHRVEAKLLHRYILEAYRGATGQVTGSMAAEKVAKDTGRYLRGGEDPVTSLGADWWLGEDFQGRPFSWGGWEGAVATRLMPLHVNQAIQAQREYGGLYGPTTFAAEFAGLGAQTWGERPDRPHSTAEKLAARFAARDYGNAKPLDEQTEKKLDELKIRARKGEDVADELDPSVSEGLITSERADAIANAKNQTYLEEKFRGLSLDDKRHVIKYATVEEKKLLEPILKRAEADKGASLSDEARKAYTSAGKEFYHAPSKLKLAGKERRLSDDERTRLDNSVSENFERVYKEFLNPQDGEARKDLEEYRGADRAGRRKVLDRLQRRALNAAHAEFRSEWFDSHADEVDAEEGYKFTDEEKSEMRRQADAAAEKSVGNFLNPQTASQRRRFEEYEKASPEEQRKTLDGVRRGAIDGARGKFKRSHKDKLVPLKVSRAYPVFRSRAAA